MIDSVRNTVLSIISKDNRGYITPFEFNLFAKQAQMEIYEDYIYTYANAMNKQNARLNGIGYSNIVRKAEEVLDMFRPDPVTLTYSVSAFPLPSDLYLTQTVIYNGSVEVDKAPSNILNLLTSNMTAPTTTYPVYTQNSNSIKVYPTTIVSNIKLDYLRTPVDPKWTWIGLTDGAPMFNQGASDYQDFELPIADEPKLVVKILQYAGISIREADIAQAASSEEVQDKQDKQ